ncbi:MAG: thioredoxin family protein, partial [Bacteroidota bacterium]
KTKSEIMKNVPFLLLLFFFAACNSNTAQEKIDNTKNNRLTLEEAQKQNKKNPKKLLVDMYTHWCGPCKMMDRSTFVDAQVIEHINKNYYAVKFNAESKDPVKFNGKEFANPNYNPDRGANRRNAPHQFTQSLQLRGYPTLVIFDQDLKVMERIVGFKRAPQLMQTLQQLDRS